MANFVKDTGFEKKTLAEIKVELESSFQGIFGNDIDLSAEGPFGQIIGILSKREADLWDGSEEIYTSRNPNEATGVSLDNISAETGVRRIDATKTQAENVLLYGDQATVIPLGSKAKQETNELTYSLLAAVTIDQAAAREIQLEPDAPSGGGGETYTVTIDGTPYTYVAIGGDTKGNVIDELIILITAGTWDGVASNIDDTYLKLLDVDLDFSATWTSTLTLFLLASGGDFEADDEGSNTLPSNTLTVIATPVSGWDDVNNPIAGETGRDVETDEELRIRRAQTFLAGNATDEAIRSALLNEVENVLTASVSSNRKLDSNSNKVVFDADFVSGNIIYFIVDGIEVTGVPFNADQSTTMLDIKSQIETDVSDSVVTIDQTDSDERTLIITRTTIEILKITIAVTGGGSQPGSFIIFCDTEGRPPKSFEAVVQGGDDDEIANQIWTTMPSGIQPYGSETVYINDSEGNNQEIHFSRPTLIYIHVKVKRDYYDEELYPTDGDDQIKENIVEWALLTFTPGKDVIRQRISIPVYEVPGIGDIEITIDGTPNPGDTPTYAEQNIPVSVRELADFDISRIVVEDLTP